MLVTDEALPRSQWPLGIIQEVIKNDSDQLVRAARIKMQYKTCQRPISKLILLEGCDDATQH